jgi:hypothetical protein
MHNRLTAAGDEKKNNLTSFEYPLAKHLLVICRKEKKQGSFYHPVRKRRICTEEKKERPSASGGGDESYLLEMLKATAHINKYLMLPPLRNSTSNRKHLFVFHIAN